MGGWQSKEYLSESELSDVESDSEWFQGSTGSEEVLHRTMQSNVIEESGDRTDAALRPVALPIAEQVVTLEKVQEIERELDDYEIVALVYLLYDTCELALQELQLLIVSGNNSGLLYRWAKSEDRVRNRWQEKLVEALCIIQNYQILKKMGYGKEDLKSRYLPHRPETSCFVNKLRKVFYGISDQLGKEPTMRFIRNMRKKLQERDIPMCNYSEDYLELYFLHWEQIHLDIGDVKDTFKMMNLEQYNDILNFVAPLESPEVNLNVDVDLKPASPKMAKKPKVRRKSTTRDTTYLQQRSVEDNFATTSQTGLSDVSQIGLSDDLNRYSIKADDPGVVLIINQEDFYTELDPQYQYLLHEDNDRLKLETRKGTMKDKSKLEGVFRRRGFKIITKENLAHYDIINAIKDVVKMISYESSLIVCILSHGDNGVVYGANSCKVDVNQIQNIICKKNKNLLGKPKVLILQSCQGKQCQKIEEETSEDDDGENANTRDGPSAIPATADLLTFWATIPGFAAIRNVHKGSWLIQELCEEIEQVSSRCHFQDICTRVVNKVTSREWKEKTGTNIMTPMVVTTLRKAFYLPSPRSN